MASLISNIKYIYMFSGVMDAPLQPVKVANICYTKFDLSKYNHAMFHWVRLITPVPLTVIYPLSCVQLRQYAQPLTQIKLHYWHNFDIRLQIPFIIPRYMINGQHYHNYYLFYLPQSQICVWKLTCLKHHFCRRSNQSQMIQ